MPATRGRLPRTRVHPLHRWIIGRDAIEVARIYRTREDAFWAAAMPYARAFTELVARLTGRLASAAGYTLEQHQAVADELQADLEDIVWYGAPLLLLHFLPDELCPPASPRRRHPQEGLVWRSPWNVSSLQVHLLDLDPEALLPHVARLANDLCWLYGRAGDGYHPATWMHDPGWQPDPLLAGFLVEIVIGILGQATWSRSYFRLWDSYARTAEIERPALPRPGDPPDPLLAAARKLQALREEKGLSTTHAITSLAKDRGPFDPSQVWREYSEARAALTIHETLQQVRRLYFPDAPSPRPNPLS